MFTVKCKSEQRIFNSNCHIINLLSCIYQTFEYEPSIVLDLADETTGSLQNLKEYPKEYANTILKPRGTYVLVQITSKYILQFVRFAHRVWSENEDGSLQYTPLWEGANQKPLTGTIHTRTHTRACALAPHTSPSNFERPSSVPPLCQSVPILQLFLVFFFSLHFSVLSSTNAHH